MLNISDLKWPENGNVLIMKTGDAVEKPSLLFEKVEDNQIEAQVNKLLATKESNEQLPNSGESDIAKAKSNISFDDFMKMDLRIGKILEAEPIPKSEKLLKLKVDTGIDQRTIVSGIAKYFKPEEIIGKQVTVLANLASRKIMGVESKGMILLSEENDGRLIFIVPESNASNGGVIS
jgi:methionyl-tRNA synthetase